MISVSQKFCETDFLKVLLNQHSVMKFLVKVKKLPFIYLIYIKMNQSNNFTKNIIRIVKD